MIYALGWLICSLHFAFSHLFLVHTCYLEKFFADSDLMRRTSYNTGCKSICHSVMSNCTCYDCELELIILLVVWARGCNIINVSNNLCNWNRKWFFSKKIRKRKEKEKGWPKDAEDRFQFKGCHRPHAGLPGPMPGFKAGQPELQPSLTTRRWRADGRVTGSLIRFPRRFSPAALGRSPTSTWAAPPRRSPSFALRPGDHHAGKHDAPSHQCTMPQPLRRLLPAYHKPLQSPDS